MRFREQNSWLPPFILLVKPRVVFFLFATYICVLSASSDNSTIKVCEHATEDCPNITQALTILSIEDTPLRLVYLEQGEHTLQDNPSHFIGKISGLSLIGKSQDPGRVNLKCSHGGGLVFYEANNLTISNLTISMCGTFSSVLNITESLNVTAALYIANSENVVLKNVVVRNTKGIGLYGINLLGQSLMEHVIFEKNTGSNLNTSLTIGGGAFLVYQDYNDQGPFLSGTFHSLEIVDSCFLSNTVGEESVIHDQLGSSDILTQSSFIRAGGGGLKVVMTQVSYDVNLLLRATTFRGNTAVYGAGAYIDVANTLVPDNNFTQNFSNVNVSIRDCLFVSNTAMYGASALLIQKPDTCTSPDLDRFEISNCNFTNNIAPSVMTNFLEQPSSPLNGTTLSVQFLNLLLTGTNKFFQNTGTAFEAIDSTVYIDGQVNVYNDTEISILVNPVNLTVMPGQRLELQVSTVDKFKQPVPSFLTLRVLSGDSQATIDNSVAWLTSGVGIISFAVSATPNKTVSISLSAFDRQCSGFSAQTEIDVDITPCRDFLYFSEATHSCACDQQLTNIGIYCNAKSDSILIPNGQWFGPVMTDEENETVLGYSHCLQDYCEPNSVNVSNQDYDFQCSEELHRSGIACGSCEHGLSATLGSSQCQQCSNFSLFLIFLFVFTGVITIVGFFVLRITITEGFLNSVLFYSNIVNLFAVYFTSPTTGKGAFFLTAWISQNFGLPACFYNGMTTLEVTGLHFVYIIYLVLLTGSLALAARYTQLPSSKQYAPSKVVATLLVICYSSLLETCIEIISFTRVSTLDGDVFIRWYFDPSVIYFQGVHALLCVFAIITFLIYIVPFPFLVISPRITYKIKFFNKLQPLLDAFWAPFKPKFRWYISFRLFIRWIPVFFSSFVPSPYNLLSMSILLVLLLFLQMHIKPFRGYWQGILDDTLILNLILVFSGYFFFEFSGVSPSPSTSGVMIYSAIFAFGAYIQFFMVFVLHFSFRFPKCMPFLTSLPSKVKEWKRNRSRVIVEQFDDFPIVTMSEVNISSEEKEEDRRNLSRELSERASQSRAAGDTIHTSMTPHPRVSLDEKKEKTESFPMSLRRVSYTEDREPLLADNEDDV